MAHKPAALAKLVDGKQVQLDVLTQDRYERVVAVVYVGDQNVNEQMVKSGHAWAYREYPKDRDYFSWEDEARQQKRGIWAHKTTDWINPSDWRDWRRKTIDTVRAYSEVSGETSLALGLQQAPCPNQRRSNGASAVRTVDPQVVVGCAGWACATNGLQDICDSRRRERLNRDVTGPLDARENTRTDMRPRKQSLTHIRLQLYRRHRASIIRCRRDESTVGLSRRREIALCAR